MKDKKEIEKLMYLDEFGKFMFEDYVIVPYQHHQNKLLWKVVITKWDMEEVGEFESCTLAVVGSKAKDAAIAGLFAFANFLKDKEECRKIECEIRNRQIREKKEREALAAAAQPEPAA